MVNIGHISLLGALATHAAEKVSNEDDHASAFCIIELGEGDGFATLVENLQLASLSESLLIRVRRTATLFLRHGCRKNGYGVSSSR
jgi:hypothetical protein